MEGSERLAVVDRRPAGRRIHDRCAEIIEGYLAGDKGAVPPGAAIETVVRLFLGLVRVVGDDDQEELTFE